MCWRKSIRIQSSIAARRGDRQSCMARKSDRQLTCAKARWPIVHTIRARLSIIPATASAALIMLLGPMTAHGADMSSLATMTDELDRWLFAGGGLIALAAAGLTGLALHRQNREHAITCATLEAQAEDARRDAECAEQLLQSDDQLTLMLQRGAKRNLANARLFGTLATRDGLIDEGLANNPARLLSFDKWLEADAARDLDDALALLRQDGTPFELAAHTISGAMVEISGKPSGSRLLVRFRALLEDQLALADLHARHKRVQRDLDSLRSLLQASDMPVWVRDDGGRLTWVNDAYAHAVEAADAETAIADDLELLDSQARNTIIKDQQNHQVSTARMNATLAGLRRVLDVTDARTTRGSAGLARDMTAIVDAENDLNDMLQFHARTMDQLTTPIAVFDADQRLRFYNSAYKDLWNFDPEYLSNSPKANELLDQLRARRLLEEQSDFASWRAKFLEHYKSQEPVHDWWHLPDGQSLQVITAPHPQGGVTQIFEDLTEKLHLESRLKRVSQLREETLDHLSEGVAVFASDGRLQLSNPAFANIWQLTAASLVAGTHIGDVAEGARLANRSEVAAHAWQHIALGVTSVEERRNSASGQTMVEHENGQQIIDYALVPLPDGLTMLTCVDVTDSVQMKQALMDRNQALEAADAIKSTFIKHVSYALRAPLTNIIGFAQLLADPAIGALNDKQTEYVDHVLTSSSSLMAIINDVLDLATVEAGIVELDLSEMDVRATIAAVVEAAKDQLKDANITLTQSIDPDATNMVGDEKRIRQVLFNLVSNAIRFSDQGSSITIAARLQGADMVLEVADEGPGIPEDYLLTARKPFESTAPTSGRRNVGLGLSIVDKFVELHNGSVEIHSRAGQGTRIVCRLPLSQDNKTAVAA